MRTSASAVSGWRDAARAVPRAAFLPERVWPFDQGGGRHRFVDRAADPDAWHAAAEADVPITTQWDDGRHNGDAPGDLPTSSASQPSLVLRMLDMLDAHRAERVLEVGTGTGWNAALLAHALGDEAVTSVEVDATVAARARRALAAVGLGPRVVTGDGNAGWPPGAPYDRMIATYGLRRIPWAWVEQMRPGGVIVVPWGTPWSPADALVRLVVAEDGASASGQFADDLVQFMKARSQRHTVEHATYVSGPWPHGADESATALGPEVMTGGSYDPALFVLGLLVRQCALAVGTQDDGTTVAWLYGLGGDASWAAVGWRSGTDGGEVYQHGPRRLWSEAEAALGWWRRRGEPGPGRFGLTISREGEHIWLDTGVPLP
ncbi:methyltransferase domain-containing protein [Streptomyces litchfieldiae]|uniref:Protein-L-isoaspartate O-methyltransferase n=1 Tax=Streptomyces litchfieldiae TaxID=3075543 RepID=A0ABU2MP04_9ACTN|nr:methyltransferase domain-containing protein [Streptomyces sp. DSM 44938]MDT0343285.1 methyltransferase domain-containing protein [Streptomyces sp. DSM 44938]